MKTPLILGQPPQVLGQIVGMPSADAVLPATVLTSPSNGALTGDLSPTFQWEAVSGASTYQLQVAGDVDFIAVIHSATGIVATAYTPSSDLILTDDTIYWRVRATGGEWSETRSLVYTLDLLMPALSNGLLWYDGSSVPDAQLVVTLIDNALFTLPLGAELILNPNFDADVTNWTPAGSGTCTWSNTNNAGGTAGEAHITVPTAGSDNTSCAAFATDPGATYQIAFKTRVDGGTAMLLLTSGAGAFYNNLNFGGGTINHVGRTISQSTGTSRQLRWRGQTNSGDFYVDEVSVKKEGQCDGTLPSGITHEAAGGEGSLGRYLFNGSSNHFLIHNHSSLNGLTNAMMVFHLNITTLGSVMTLLEKSGRWLTNILADGKIDFTANYGTTNARAISTDALTTGNHTVVVGISGVTPYIFIDGEEVTYSQQDDGAGSPASNTNNWFIGRTAAGTQFYEGGLQQFALFGAAITEAKTKAFDVLRVA